MPVAVSNTTGPTSTSRKLSRPAFRDYAEAVEARLGPKRVTALRTALVELRQAIDDELEVREETAPPDRRAV
jgi:hypothetical protein